ncbi:hypothetical protein ACWGPQ_02720 [Saccharomonospora azurea]
MSAAGPVHVVVSSSTALSRSALIDASSVPTFCHVSACELITSGSPVSASSASDSGPTCSSNQPTPAARIEPKGSSTVPSMSRPVPTTPITPAAQSPLSMACLVSNTDSSNGIPEYASVESCTSAISGLLTGGSSP